MNKNYKKTQIKSITRNKKGIKRLNMKTKIKQNIQNNEEKSKIIIIKTLNQ